MKIETPLLKRLGPVPLWRGEQKCLDSLESLYREAVTWAQGQLERIETQEHPQGPSAPASPASGSDKQGR